MSMDKRFDKIETKLESIDASLSSIDKTLAINTEQLALHIKRTELLERELRPIKAHVEQLRGAGKLIGIMALVATIASVILML